MDDVVRMVPLPTAKEAPALHAGFWRRVAAYIVDALILDFLLYVLMAIGWAIATPTIHSPYNNLDGAKAFFVAYGWFWYFGSIVAIWLYFALFERSRFQATPGKMALGLVVTDECGRRIGFGRATGRYFAKILSGLIFCIGYMMAGWTERKQALHDMLAGTCVVQKSALASLSQDGDGPTAITARSVPGWGVALIVVGAGAVVVAMIAVVSAISIPLYLGYASRARVTEAVNDMHKVRDTLVDYRGEHGTWPALGKIDLFNITMQTHAPIGRYTDVIQVIGCAGKACSIVATMKATIGNGDLAGKTFELWTADGGKSWHCGPGGANPAALKALPESCRERAGSLL